MDKAERESLERYGGSVKVGVHSTVHGMLNRLDHSGNPHLYNPEMEHIARHDPARVLREVAAKRRILRVHAPSPESWSGKACTGCGRSAPCDDWLVEDVDDCPTLRALVVAGHDVVDTTRG